MTARRQASEQSAIWTYAVPIGGGLLLLGIGFAVLRQRVTALTERLTFATDFRVRFIDYCNSRGNDSEAYTWLMLNSGRMQNEMGVYGVYDSFKPPAANYMIRNYQIITNMLPELRRYIDQNNQGLGTIFAPTIDSYAKAIDESLLRYIGVLNERDREARGALKNPLLWLRTGVEQVLSAPLLILVWIGLVGSNAIWRLQGSRFFKALAGIATIVGLFAAVMTIFLGWTQFVELVDKAVP